MPANNQATDFLCENCGHPYELKSRRAAKCSIITDGAYAAMMRAIAASKTPSFLLMRYSTAEQVFAVSAVHRVFITAQAIQERKPLAPTARRAGWIGCNIRMDRVPAEAKIAVVENERFLDREAVRERFQKISKLSGKKSESRGWMAAVLNIAHRLPSRIFTLHELDQFIPELQQIFPNNRHIPDKIRQQLQFLRDAGLVHFLGKGHYELAAMPVNQKLMDG